MALCQAPFVMDDPHVGLLFPPDAIATAKKYLAMTSGGVGKFQILLSTSFPGPILTQIQHQETLIKQEHCSAILSPIIVKDLIQ